MANEYYDHGSFPSTGSQGSSAAMRAELNSVEGGFDKLPALAGNGGKPVRVKSDASGLEAGDVSSASISFTPAGNLSSTNVQAALQELDSEKVATTATIAINRGGTNLTTYAAGDIIYASATDTLAKLPKAAAGSVLLSGDTPSWGKVGLTTHVSGTLAVGNGGTGATTFTSGGLLRGNGTSALSIASAADIVAAIGATEVQNATTAANVTVASASGAFGYASGAGGTVTQATSKFTAVTLNKPCGQITMNNAALAAGATAYFTLNNSQLGSTDCLVIHPRAGSAGGYEYQAWVSYLNSGVAVINVKNTTGGSLSDAVILSFTVIKGASA